MREQKDWHKDQPRGGNKPYLFAPKWNESTLIFIMENLPSMGFTEMQMRLVRDYSISPYSASVWISIAKRVEQHLNSGLSMQQALQKDLEWRNAKKRKGYRKKAKQQE